MKIKLLIILLLSSSIAFAQKHKFEIQGTVGQGLQNKKLYFSRIKMNGQRVQEAQPLAVSGGKFILKGELEEPEQGIISFNRDVKPDTSSLTFLIDKGSILIKIDEKLASAKVTNSKANDDFKKYLSTTISDTQEFNEFYTSLEQQLKKGANRDSLQAVFENAYTTYQQDMYNARLKFVKANPGAFISLILLPQIADMIQDYTLIDDLFNSLSPEVKQTPSAKTIKEKFGTERKLAIGAVAPIFSQSGPDGKVINLTDFRGKYVLVDFWASWCGPCRQENPNVVNAYNQYKDRNFTILGVSLDRQQSGWLKAIEDDKLTWAHVSDLKQFENKVAKLYNVSAIPQNFLLDPQGKIVAKNLRGEQLGAKLAELLK